MVLQRCSQLLRCKGAADNKYGGAEVQMCRDVDMVVLRCRDGAGAPGKQRGAEVVQRCKGGDMQRWCRGGKEQVQRC